MQFVGGSFSSVPPRWLTSSFDHPDDAGVVPGRDEFGIDSIGVVEQATELDPMIALHAGIGRSTTQIVIDEIIDDAAKVLLEIEGVKRDVHLRCDAAGIGGVRRGTASLLVIGSSLGQTAQYRQIGRGQPARGISSTRQTWLDSSPCRMKTPITSWPASSSKVRSDARIDAATHR